MIKIEELIFHSEIDKIKKVNIPKSRINENKIILNEIEKNNKKNEENGIKSTINQKINSKSLNEISISTNSSRIKNNNININQNINGDIGLTNHVLTTDNKSTHSQALDSSNNNNNINKDEKTENKNSKIKEYNEEDNEDNESNEENENEEEIITNDEINEIIQKLLNCQIQISNVSSQKVIISELKKLSEKLNELSIKNQDLEIYHLTKDLIPILINFNFNKNNDIFVKVQKFFLF